jgi:flagellin
MRINNNLMAMNTHRQLGINSGAGAKSIEKLSSGYRINRAGDDAAGLAISEKMRGQIRGLNQASRNSQDAISLVQTAEGALNETQAILQRMRELAVQSASDTNVDTDRTAIQNEIEQLVTEIDRISDTTEFNTQKLLDGSFDGTFQIGANETQTMDLSISGVSTAKLGLSTSVTMAGTDISASNTGNAALGDGVYTVGADGVTITNAAGDAVGQVSGGVADPDIDLSDGTTVTTGQTANLNAGDLLVVSDSGATLDVVKDLETGAENTVLAAGNYVMSGTEVMKDGTKIGDLAGTTITLNDAVTTIDMAAVFGLDAADLADTKEFTVNGADVSTQSAAEGSITSINDALESVSAERAKLGAVQNRLEHTIKNLDTTSENLQASESRIRDVDMAKEMMEFTKNNILQQAAQSMLAQANQAPQGVLQLLR